VENKVLIFNTKDWIISKDPTIRYERMRKTLRQMNVLKALKGGSDEEN